MIVYTCNPSLQRLRQEKQDFKASLGYIARPPSQKKSNVVIHTYKPNYLEGGDRRILVQGQPEQES
jgi:hypothetical protein